MKEVRTTSPVGAIGALLAGAGMEFVETFESVLQKRSEHQREATGYRAKQREAEASMGGFPLRPARGLSGVVSGPSGVLYARVGSTLVRVFPKAKGKAARKAERAARRVARAVQAAEASS